MSAPEDLAIHGVRVLGFPTASRVAARYGLDVDAVHEALLDFEARGWVRRSSFAGSSGWSLTDAGRAENERRLADELDRAGARDAVTDVHTAFVPLNRRFGAVCTDWQIRPTRLDPMAFNDHADWAWDGRVLRTLANVGKSFTELCGQLTECLLLPHSVDPVPRRSARHPRDPTRNRHLTNSLYSTPKDMNRPLDGSGSHQPRIRLGLMRIKVEKSARKTSVGCSRTPSGTAVHCGGAGILTIGWANGWQGGSPGRHEARASRPSAVGAGHHGS
ncbi:hypothetical protein [Actinomadura latina]|uniref:hypothetical protein n=1 Tax=Actinomadura latina TaxID=163603 RepID=UPI000A82EA63|nr:hypothetical protein [Actinomadura latina]